LQSIIFMVYWRSSFYKGTFMPPRRNRKQVFRDYCERVRMYLSEECMVNNVDAKVDNEDIGFYFRDKHDVQTAAMLIKEVLD